MATTAETKPSRQQMQDVLTFRALPGFREQLRETARREGLSVGELVRSALTDRLARAASSDRQAA